MDPEDTEKQDTTDLERGPSSETDEPRPWWDKALDPLRYEAAMFRVLLWVAAGGAVVIALVSALRAIF